MAEGNFTIEMKTKVTDTITGFQGMVTGRAEYLTGCRQYGVTPKVDKDGKLNETQWLDEDRLVSTVALARRKAAQPMKKRNLGGPQSSPAPTK